MLFYITLTEKKMRQNIKQNMNNYPIYQDDIINNNLLSLKNLYDY